jgi:hypothetical protein
MLVLARGKTNLTVERETNFAYDFDVIRFKTGIGVSHIFAKKLVRLAVGVGQNRNRALAQLIEWSF